MKKNIISKLFIVAILSITLFSCYEQEVSDVIDPSKYATATITPNAEFNGSSVMEGETVTFDIVFDKSMGPDVEFDVTQMDGDAEVHIDYDYSGGLVNGYYTSAKLIVDFPADMIVEPNKTLSFKLEVPSLGQKYLLSPQTQYPEYTIDIINVNDPSGLTINTDWEDHHDDWDTFIVDEAITGEFSGYSGATGAVPEAMLLGNDEADDTYYVEVDPYSVENDVVVLTFNIGHPDQTNETLSFTYDVAESDGYPQGNFGPQIVKIVKVGETYTCSIAE